MLETAELHLSLTKPLSSQISPGIYATPASGAHRSVFRFLPVYTYNSDNALLENFPVEKLTWIRFVLLLLGKYGEDKIFGFIINDPSYDNAVKTNRNAELDASSESLTVRMLNKFKASFEETLDQGVSLSDEKYIDLYFEYLFGKIIKGN